MNNKIDFSSALSISKKVDILDHFPGQLFAPIELSQCNINKLKENLKL